MTIHHTVLAEVDRQRREQIAASIAISPRVRASRRRRWWERDHLQRPTATATSAQMERAAPSRAVISGMRLRSALGRWLRTIETVTEPHPGQGYQK
jgi:hypothetical protein